MNVHVGPEGAQHDPLLPARELVDLADSLAELEPVRVVQILAKRRDRKRMVRRDGRHEATVRTVVLACLDAFQARVRPVQTFGRVVERESVRPR